MQKQQSLFLFIIFSWLTVGYGGNDAKKNPFSPMAFVNRYWDKHITNKLPKPTFLLSKASPLSAMDTAAFANLAANNALSTRLPEFCTTARLFCFPDAVTPNLAKHTKDAHFAVYNDGQNFTNYGTRRAEGLDSFKNYSDGLFTTPVNDFRRYSRNSLDHGDNFASYGNGGNVIDESFHTYGTHANSGAGEFKQYSSDSNVPELGFTSYSDGALARQQSFTHYSEDGNSGEQKFTSYGKSGFHDANEFAGYGTDSNVAGSHFSNYADRGLSPNDTFTNYGVNMNVPDETFKNYAHGSFDARESFANYRDQSNVGDDSFQSYAKDTRGGAQVDFTNYGKSFNQGTDTFKGYAKGASPSHPNSVGFKEYGVNNTFKDYAKQGVTFARYTNATATAAAPGSAARRWVEPGKFFRERMLKQGTVMPMPDIRDKMPQRSFLPRAILTKLPFSSSKISDLKAMFKVPPNSSLEKIMMDSLVECERAPSQGETKKCVGSVEDMIDFATSVLGHNIAVRTTHNVNGSNTNVMVGPVRGINGGKLTRSVSCHQSLFPFLLYYCHAVPKVRVYEADLLDPKSKAKINHGVAICHLDTTAWSPTHGAFLALGSGPGRIEVCHWIFQNDMTWTIAN